LRDNSTNASYSQRVSLDWSLIEPFREDYNPLVTIETHIGKMKEILITDNLKY
jgi:hypothetical protein